MSKATIRMIVSVLNHIIFDVMIDGKVNDPQTAVRSLRDVANLIEKEIKD